MQMSTANFFKLIDISFLSWECRDFSLGSHNKTKFVGTSLDILFTMSKDGPKSSKDVVKRSVKGKPTRLQWLSLLK